MNESIKVDKYLDLAREVEKMWNIKVMVIPVWVGVLGTIPNDLENRQGEMEMRGRTDVI